MTAPTLYYLRRRRDHPNPGFWDWLHTRRDAPFLLTELASKPQTLTGANDARSAIDWLRRFGFDFDPSLGPGDMPVLLTDFDGNAVEPKDT